MRKIKLIFILTCISVTVFANSSQTKENHKSSLSSQTILIDVTHGQKFWDNPEKMHNGNLERVKYMTGEIIKAVEPLDANITFVNDKIEPDNLKDCGVLFIHVPSLKYNESEIRAINQFLNNGGSLFLVMEEDYWTTLELSNVNDIIKPYDLKYEGEIKDSTSGGHTKTKNISSQSLKIPFAGGRVVKGGTPFCFINNADETPFGIYKKLKNGGKIIVMGDGMVSLFMTSWDGVDGYQCKEFMHDVFKWLLE